MSKIFVLANEPIAISSKLFGIKDAELVNNIDELKDKIMNLINEKERGIVMLTSDLYNKLDDSMKRTIAISNTPLFIVIPLYKEGKTDYMLREIVLKALGIDIMGLV